MKLNKFKLNFVGICALALTLITLDCVIGTNIDSINNYFQESRFDSSDFKDVATKSNELVQSIEEEGAVLLKNKDNCLPLKMNSDKTPINVFGWNSCDQGNVLNGVGSGASPISDTNKVTLVNALELEGFEVNNEIISKYDSFYNGNFINENDSNDKNKRLRLIQPSIDSYSSEMISKAKSFSSTAIVMISRILGENMGEAPNYQKKINSNGSSLDYTKHYLELSNEEKDLLNMVEKEFDDVIVLINSTNTMELSFLNDDRIDAALSIGLPGQSGMIGVAKILKGEVNPSGKLTNTYPVDLTTEPSYSNRFPNKDNEDMYQITYKEGLYFGYRWYETACEEKYYSQDYKNIVQYPFGYGLSYTTFDWDLKKVDIDPNSKINKDSTITLTLDVKNIGDYAGKDVIQLYGFTPYFKGQIEKSSIQLVAFEKTNLLNPGETQKDIKLSFKLYDLASYDAYDKNENGHKGYELDKGTYTFKLMNNCHEIKSMDDYLGNSISFDLEETINYSKDPTTENTVENRFTALSSYASTPIDGSSVNIDQNYLTRDDFNKSYPKATDYSTIDKDKIKTANDYSYKEELDKTIATLPTQKNNNNLLLTTDENGSKLTRSQLENSETKLKYNEDLIKKIGSDYNSKELSDLIDQMSYEEMCELSKQAGYKTIAVESIGKPQYNEYDGPAGLNTNSTSIEATKWTAFPNEVIIGQTWNKQLARQLGYIVAKEGKETGVSGWYAPGVNLHRSSFSGRNYEYYSEDPVLSGKIGGNVIEGARAGGMYTYIKHFALSELGDNFQGLNTWISEQTLREIYLRPFEIAVKEYKCTGVMSSFGRIGAVWSGANNSLLNNILRNEWGFRGAVITDYTTYGDPPMDIQHGIVAGNDLWLTAETNYQPLDTDDPVYMTCVKKASKDTIYMIANAFEYSTKFNNGEGIFTKPVLNSTKTNPWVYGLIAGNIIWISGLGVWTYFLYHPLKEKKNKEE